MRKRVLKILAGIAVVFAVTAGVLTHLDTTDALTGTNREYTAAVLAGQEGALATSSIVQALQARGALDAAGCIGTENQLATFYAWDAALRDQAAYGLWVAWAVDLFDPERFLGAYLDQPRHPGPCLSALATPVADYVDRNLEREGVWERGAPSSWQLRLMREKALNLQYDWMSAADMNGVLRAAKEVVVVETPHLDPDAWGFDQTDTPTVTIESDADLDGSVLVVPTIDARFRFDLAKPPRSVWLINWGRSAPVIDGLAPDVPVFRSGVPRGARADLALTSFMSTWLQTSRSCTAHRCTPLQTAHQRLTDLHGIQPTSSISARTSAPTQAAASDARHAGVGDAKPLENPTETFGLDPAPGSPSLAYRRLLMTIHAVRAKVLESYISRIADTHPVVADCARTHLREPLFNADLRLDDAFFQEMPQRAMNRVDRFRTCALPWRAP